MSRRGSRYSVFALAILLLRTSSAQAGQPAGQPRPTNATPGLPDYTRGARAFPGVLSPYKPAPIQPLRLENSPRLRDRLRDGRLRLSLSDALALALENNLDIAVQRYVPLVAQADVLRTSSGQAARGVPGALLPSGLSAGALGVGVNQAAGTGGVGGAGGISGGGGAVSVPQVGTFDPAVSVSSSYDRTISPLNSLVVAGVPQVQTLSAAGSINYTQLFPEGTSITLTVNGIGQNSTQQSLLFNPAVVSRFAMGFNQPLLSGFGSVPNKRFLMVAKNDMRTSEQLFRQQVVTTIVQVENAYWDLVAAQQAIAAATLSRDAARRLVEDTEARVEVGTAAGIDVASTASALASSERDRIVAETSFQLQQAQLKSLLSKTSDAELDAATIETTDTLPQPDLRAVPDVSVAIASAIEKRPELQAAAMDASNQDLAVRYTRNGLLPNVSAFGLYAGAGLTGDSAQLSHGLATSLDQAFGAAYPEYAAGVSATIPLRNRSAQADNIRARLEEQQLTVSLERSRQRIALEVRQAIIGLTQGQAQVNAASEALRLAERIAQAEGEKLELGVSTAYDVVLRERDLLTARQASVASQAAYAKAIVEFDRATGEALERNGIQLRDALVGEALTAPKPDVVQTALAPRP